MAKRPIPSESGELTSSDPNQSRKIWSEITSFDCFRALAEVAEDEIYRRKLYPEVPAGIYCTWHS